MSRLDSAIRRLSAQRDCLQAAVAGAPEGAILEIGLGNGRTYDHLREIAPARDIWVIDREMNAHPDSAPPDAFFLQGEADAMLEALHARIGRSVALAHYDLGVGVPEHDTPLREGLAPRITRLLVPGAYLLSNSAFEGMAQEPLPEGVAEKRYFIHRAG